MTTDADTPRMDDFVVRLLASQRAVAAAQAEQTRLLADAQRWAVEAGQRGSRRPSVDDVMAVRELACEFGTAVRLSDRTMQLRMNEAATLVEGFAAIHEAWSDGRIDRAHVSVIVEAGTPLPPGQTREWFVEQVLPRAEELSAAALRPVARAIADIAHPVSLVDRHTSARAQRCVRVTDLDDGMARLTADLPAVLARGIHDRLTQVAFEVRNARIAAVAVARPADELVSGAAFGIGVTPGPGQSAAHAPAVAVGFHRSCVTAPSRALLGAADASDSDRVLDSSVGASGPGAHDLGAHDTPAVEDTRSVGELRADILSDLLLGGGTVAHGDGMQAIRARVQIQIPVLTVTGNGNAPATLAGHGPVPADVALRLAGSAPGWDRVMTHPVTGTLLAVDRYRPNEDLKRFLRVRDERCRFPGCRMPVWRCDIDHTIDHAHGGATAHDNLEHACRRHHVVKHNTAWSVTQHAGGVLTWRSPTGRVYTDRPEPVVRFVADDDRPPPF